MEFRRVRCTVTITKGSARDDQAWRRVEGELRKKFSRQIRRLETKQRRYRRPQIIIELSAELVASSVMIWLHNEFGK